jgi:hypothetical protein
MGSLWLGLSRPRRSSMRCEAWTDLVP